MKDTKDIQLIDPNWSKGRPALTQEEEKLEKVFKATIEGFLAAACGKFPPQCPYAPCGVQLLEYERITENPEGQAWFAGYWYYVQGKGNVQLACTLHAVFSLLRFLHLTSFSQDQIRIAIGKIFDKHTASATTSEEEYEKALKEVETLMWPNGWKHIDACR